MTEGGGGGERLASEEAAASLAEGLAFFANGEAGEAHRCFARAHRRSPGDLRVMSWYGLTLVLVEKNSSLGMLYCDQAVRLGGPEPEISLNQARVHLALSQRERAVKAIARGLALNPDDQALRTAQASMGWRRRPILPCLPRSNFLNRWLGKLRWRWSRRINPVPTATPLTLGILPPGEGPPRS